jgi:NADH-quinone oxidoreductase subunit C
MSQDVVTRLSGRFPDVAFEQVLDSNQDVARPSLEQYVPLVTAAHDVGFNVFADLCGVDYLHRKPRFEVVLNLLSHEHVCRLRIRVGVPAADPTVPSITEIFPGANFYEREAFDLFGIVFSGHPDLTRIVLPDDWEGYPLRKDYGVGSVPVRFKESPKTT